MRPFKMFFGLSLAIILFFFIAKFFVFAFIAAAVMSVVYAIFRRLKDFITYDRFGDHYFKRYKANPQVASNWQNEVEPLFFGSSMTKNSRREDIRFVDIQ